jgi:hypothetical protein
LNERITSRIVEMNVTESDALLAYLTRRHHRHLGQVTSDKN